MANIKSAAKRAQIAKVRTLRNKSAMSRVKTTIKAVEAAVAENANFENIYWAKAGCTISCHCGPGTLGVLFVRK